MGGLEEVGDPVEGVIVDEHGAEQSLFGLDVVGGFPIERRFRRAEFESYLCHDIPNLFRCVVSRRIAATVHSDSPNDQPMPVIHRTATSSTGRYSGTPNPIDSVGHKA